MQDMTQATRRENTRENTRDNTHDRPLPPDAPARIGYCCVYIPPDRDKAQTRRMNISSTTIAALSRMERAAALEKVRGLVAHNVTALQEQLSQLGTLPPLQRLLRISSDLLPAYTHPVARWMYAEPTVRSLVERGLGDAGALARKLGIRLSLHPGQFCVLATVNEETLEKSIEEFEYHTDIMRWLGLSGGWHPHGAHINIHVGSAAGGVDRFRAALPRLSDDARGLITVENDEMMFGLDDVLGLADQMPVVLDFHHHWIASGGEYLRPDNPQIARVRQSWRGVRPVSHVSVSQESLLHFHSPDELPDYQQLTQAGFTLRDLRAHSDLMWNNALNRLIASHLGWTDIEVEAKHKNLAVAQLAACA